MLAAPWTGIGSPPELTLYGRSYCHLCEDMQVALLPGQSAGWYRLAVVDVDSDPELEARLGERVPVLMLGNVEICHYHLDAERLREVLGAIR